MTYILKTYNSARHIATKEEVSENICRLAVVEVNVKDFSLYDAESGFREILDVIWNNLSPKQSADEFPNSLASKIEFHLSQEYKLRKRIYALSYVGIATEDSKVFVSWAGLFRVHLSIDGHVTMITRDHNLVSDPENLIASSTPPITGAMDFYTPTRQLLANRTTNDRPWESVTWDVVGEYELVVCSDFYHRFRDPKEYVSHYSYLMDSDIKPDPVPGGGIITKLSLVNGENNRLKY